MMLAVDRLLPSLRAWRSRRMMFSTSMIASSTTTPSAITKPASTIVLTVAPVANSTSTAASRDSGIATTQISAVRHSNRNATSTSTTRMQPSSSAWDRLSMEVSMKLAGRKILVSISTPGSPGFIASRAASTPRVTSSVLPQGNFSTISIRPGPSLMTASPTIPCGPYSTFATSPSSSCLPSRFATAPAPAFRGSRTRGCGGWQSVGSGFR